MIISNGQFIFRQPEFFGYQFPSPGNSFVFEIIAEREVSEHFKKCVVAYGVSDIVQVIMFAAGANGFLGSGRSFVVARFVAGENIFELYHT